VVAQVDDRVLVDAAQAGDLDAYETLVRRYQAGVYRIALRLLQSRADADDVTQEAFVRAWRSLSHFRGDSAFSTWLYRIVTRRCFDLLGARRPAEALSDDHLDAGADPAATVEQRERLHAVTGQIAALPPDQRAALVLREFEGLSYQEVADVLDTSVPAIKGRIHRARLTILKETTAWR
jgi:RNA polymerase sigma-70 factor, ECF subfamily